MAGPGEVRSLAELGVFWPPSPAGQLSGHPLYSELALEAGDPTQHVGGVLCGQGHPHTPRPPVLSRLQQTSEYLLSPGPPLWGEGEGTDCTAHIAKCGQPSPAGWLGSEPGWAQGEPWAVSSWAPHSSRGRIQRPQS